MEGAKQFGFFILDNVSCINLPGLLKYLSKVVHVDHQCIYCRQRFQTAEAVQKHMVDKEHCMMDDNDFEQYDPFYDFDTENRRIAQKMQEKFKDKTAENTYVYRLKAEDDDSEEWEDDEDEEEMLKSKPKKAPEVYTIRRAKRLETGELLLPGGNIAGSRSYAVYYKQKLRLREHTYPIRQIMSDKFLQRKVLKMQEALVLKKGATGGMTQIALRTYNAFVTKMKRAIDRETRSEMIRDKKWWVRTGVASNKLQKYFRDRNIIFG